MGTLFTGMSLNLTCKINTPDVIWLDSNRNQIDVNVSRFNVSNLITVNRFLYISTLTIAPLNTSDSGIYYCTGVVMGKFPLEKFTIIIVEGKLLILIHICEKV